MFEQAFKNIDDVLWKEAGCTTELDYTEQTSWLLFLKYLDGYGIIEHLGDSNATTGSNPLRSQPRESFIPGQFICPHGACFDRDGNIFVVEWVEVGRVTKLRKVANGGRRRIEPRPSASRD